MQMNVMDTKLDGIIVSHVAQVKIDKTGTGKDDPSYRVEFKVDFTGWTVRNVVDLALRSLVISAQRVWRTLSVEEVKHLSGRTFMASDMGKQPKSQVDVQAAYMSRFAAASPEEQAKMLAELQALAGKKE
jgi:hypothetical protein